MVILSYKIIMKVVYPLFENEETLIVIFNYYTDTGCIFSGPSLASRKVRIWQQSFNEGLTLIFSRGYYNNFLISFFGHYFAKWHPTLNLFIETPILYFIWIESLIKTIFTL